MTLVQSEITGGNVERARRHPEFLIRREREQTLEAKTPDFLDAFKPQATPYESTYLSHPSEEFSLRVQVGYTADGPLYEATIKDRGEESGDALDRLEVKTPISEATYQYYASQDQFPEVKFLRAKPLDGLSVDFVDGLENPLVEYESALGDAEPELVTVLKTGLTDRSNDPTVRKEAIAHALHGSETLVTSGEALENFAHRIFNDMIANYVMGYKQVVVGMSGISGSGKSTAVRVLQEKFTETYGQEFTPIVLSSDDYHRGKKWLETEYGAPWTNWDDPRVYNTAELAQDIERLKNGESILRKHFDFATEEVVYDEEIAPQPFVIVEGLYAGSPDLKDVRHLHYEVPTGIATSVGRDVRRMILEERGNGSIATPEDRLRYQLEVALPTYLEQQKPGRNARVGYCPPMAERAFLLQSLTTPLKQPVR